MTFERPLVAVANDGNPSDLSSAALVGLPFIRLFNLVTDVSAAELSMHRNAQAPSKPDYNMSGLWINRDKKGLSAGIVGQGSPADLAGIKPGDAIAGEFRPIIDALNGPEGSIVPLRVGSGAGQREVTLRLTDYL